MIFKIPKVFVQDAPRALQGPSGTLQSRHQKSPRPLPNPQGVPKRAPRRAPEPPKRAQDRLKKPQDGPRWPPDPPPTTPRPPQNRSRPLQVAQVLHGTPWDPPGTPPGPPRDRFGIPPGSPRDSPRTHPGCPNTKIWSPLRCDSRMPNKQDLYKQTGKPHRRKRVDTHTRAHTHTHTHKLRPSLTRTQLISHTYTVLTKLQRSPLSHCLHHYCTLPVAHSHTHVNGDPVC